MVKADVTTIVIIGEKDSLQDSIYTGFDQHCCTHRLRSFWHMHRAKKASWYTFSVVSLIMDLFV